ncbi:hypothetical protein [Bradyrhizobium oligotrophicum]|nr:hypothetical protein [Bradyrhizobium oligotrophicum]
MKPSTNKTINKTINKTWLGIGIVTAARLLASSAATSPVVAAPAEPAPSRIAAVGADASASRPVHAMRQAMPRAAAPRYYGRPTDYAPAYPPGPFVLFTPFFD